MYNFIIYYVYFYLCPRPPCSDCTLLQPGASRCPTSRLWCVWDGADELTRCANGDEGCSKEGRDHIHTDWQLHDGTQVDGQVASGDAEYHTWWQFRHQEAAVKNSTGLVRGGHQRGQDYYRSCPCRRDYLCPPVLPTALPLLRVSSWQLMCQVSHPFLQVCCIQTHTRIMQGVL